MIETVWPGPRNAVVCADWTELPFAPGSQDLALCDGGLSLVSHPHDHIRLVQSLHGVLAPAGLCLLRLYVPAAEPESAVAVLDELLVGKISNPNILKLRLGMALQDDPTRGVQLAHVWDVLHQAVPDLKEFAERFGWPPGPWLAINTYRECARWYHFLTVAEVDHLFTRAPGGFTRELLQTPPGEFGDRCPIVVYRSRRSDSAGDGGE
jgi:SAM-dependent methyltransferase